MARTVAKLKAKAKAEAKANKITEPVKKSAKSNKVKSTKSAEDLSKSDMVMFSFLLLTFEYKFSWKVRKTRSNRNKLLKKKGI